MKNEDVKIGMKVVPFQKTYKSEDWGDLSTSAEWGIALRNHQPFLYVTEWSLDAECWCLSHENVPDTWFADFFNASDFYLYDPEWIDIVSEPSPAELATMNASAEELRLQFEG